MILRDIQRLEIVVIVLDLRSFDDAEAHADKDVLHLLLNLRERMALADLRGFTGHCDIEALALQLLLESRALVSLSLLGDRVLDVLANLVRQLSHLRALLSRELSHSAKDAGELALLAQKAYPDRLKVGVSVLELCLCSFTDLNKFLFHVVVPFL